jgi:hypothetical protein
MANAEFVFIGGSDTGNPHAYLVSEESKNADDPIHLEHGKPISLPATGQYDLFLEVPGYPLIRQRLHIDAESHPPVVKPADRCLQRSLSISRERNTNPASGAQSDWLFVLRGAFAKPKEFVFVVGQDYKALHKLVIKKGESRYLELMKGPWRGKKKPFQDIAKYSSTRMNDLLRRNSGIGRIADASTLVTVFDFRTGVRKIFMLHGCEKGARPDEQSLDKSWRPVHRFDYGAPLPMADELGGLSVTDVYRWIVDGVDEYPGRVVEFSFFSHAWIQGPILVNTSDFVGVEVPNRDDTDHDARVKDFSGIEFDLKKFARAFADDSQCFNFGCFASQDLRAAIDLVTSDAKEDKAIYININDDRQRKTKAQSRKGLARIMKGCYSMALAEASGRPCWGAPAGIGSNHREKRVGGRSSWYHFIRPIGDIERMRKIYGIEKNTRGYFRYDKALAKRLEAFL